MKALAESVKRQFPNLVLEAYEDRGDAYVVIKKEGIRDIAHALKTGAEFAFDVLMDLTAVDYIFWPEKAVRFEVVYNFYSTSNKHRLFVKALVPESDTALDSVTSFWPGADWLERETFDMFGIVFKGHPGLKRILMYEGFEGHALRKDYPVNKRQPVIGPMN